MMESTATLGWSASLGIGLLIVVTAVPLAPRPRRGVDSDGRVRRRFLPTGIARRGTRFAAFVVSRRSRSAPVGPSDIATWVDDLARSVRHGSTLRHTVETCHPTHAALAAATESLRRSVERGRSLVDACHDWANGLHGHPPLLRHHLRAVSSILVVASTAGGGVSEPLDRLAAAMRLAAADAMERTAQSAQAAMSARVLTLVPLAVLGLLLAVDEDVRQVVASATGAIVVGTGVALNLLGGRWMRRIISGGTT